MHLRHVKHVHGVETGLEGEGNVACGIVNLPQTAPVRPLVLGQFNHICGNPILGIGAVVVAGQKVPRQVPRRLAVDEVDVGIAGDRPDCVERRGVLECLDDQAESWARVLRSPASSEASAESNRK